MNRHLDMEFTEQTHPPKESEKQGFANNMCNKDITLCNTKRLLETWSESIE